MRTLRLARIAAEAEGLRLRSQLQRTAIRIGFGLVALVFLTGALVFVHVGIWYWLRLGVGWTQQSCSFAIAAGDVVLAMFLMLLAARSGPGRVEMEALEVRRRAVQNVASSLALSSLLLPILQMGVGMFRRR